MCHCVTSIVRAQLLPIVYWFYRSVLGLILFQKDNTVCDSDADSKNFKEPFLNLVLCMIETHTVHLFILLQIGFWFVCIKRCQELDFGRWGTHIWYSNTLKKVKSFLFNSVQIYCFLRHIYICFTSMIVWRVTTDVFRSWRRLGLLGSLRGIHSLHVRHGHSAGRLWALWWTWGVLWSHQGESVGYHWITAYFYHLFHGCCLQIESTRALYQNLRFCYCKCAKDK